MSESEEQTKVRHVVAYRAESRVTLSYLLLGVLLLVGLLGIFIFVQLTTRPAPLDFQLNDKMQIIEPVPLDQEGISKPALLNWVNSLLITAFSYNYTNIDKQQSKLAEYLSETAMESYLNLLNTDEDLYSVRDLQFVVSVTPKSAPEIIVSRAFRGRYAWQVRIPLTLTLSNAIIKSSQQATIEFLVLRVPETEAPLGIKVAGFNYKVESRTRREGIRGGGF